MSTHGRHAKVLSSSNDQEPSQSGQHWFLGRTGLFAAAIGILMSGIVWLRSQSADVRITEDHPIRKWVHSLHRSRFMQAEVGDLELTSLLGQNWYGSVIYGAIHWPNSSWNAPFSILPSLIKPEEAKALKQILIDAPHDFDEDRDGVDEMITYEFVIWSVGAMKSKDPPRESLRQRLHALTAPIIQKRIEPFVRQRYPKARRVCHSMIRRYLHNERRTHGTHWDVPSFVSVVVSLDSTGTDFEGGFYVSTGTGLDSFIPLQQGDTVVHQGDLLHGVHVRKGERWSWAMWFQDTDDCSSEPSQWWKEEAATGDPVAQTLRAMRSRDAGETLSLIRSAATRGFPRALVYFGRAHLEGWNGQEQNRTGAKHWYHKAHLAGAVDAAYHLGLLEREDRHLEAARTFFQEGAERGDPKAMEEFAALCLNGTSLHPRNLDLATHWFQLAADFSETAMYQTSMLYSQATSSRPADKALASLFLERAGRLGHLQAMRELVEPLLRQQRWQEAVPWLLRLESGPPIEKFVKLYESGVSMTPFALFRAAQILQSFADQGHSEARNLLSRMEAAWRLKNR